MGDGQELIAYLVAGRVLVWALGWTPLLDPLRKYKKVQELLECDFCLGFWVYSLLAFFFKPRIVKEVKTPVVREFITGLLVSFAVHVFRVGWEVRFNAVRKA